jgi:hypothetical protein
MLDVDHTPPTTNFVTDRQQQGEVQDHLSFPAIDSKAKGQGQDAADSVWKKLQATELDMVAEGEDDTLQALGVKPPSTNKSATFRKGRIIRMGSATL